MIKIGLTGNIGSGKSTVARIFNILGIPVFNADIEAKKILQQPDTIVQLNSYFGDKINGIDGLISKPELAKIVFNNKEALSYLNSLIHPRVAETFNTWVKNQTKAPYIIHEAAILFESGFNDFMDKVIYVSAPESLRIERVKNRDHLTKAEIKKRMKAQWPDEKKIISATHVINNGTNDLLIPQVLQIHKKYAL